MTKTFNLLKPYQLITQAVTLVLASLLFLVYILRSGPQKNQKGPLKAGSEAFEQTIIKAGS